ncbi:hypothetical protein RHO13_01830 [Orbus wheelerorum]|uniref:hypothetical protein n=1 Tax=Orbus wheelerorum TaxID=3074111 RepID=UPI00370D5B72
MDYKDLDYLSFLFFKRFSVLENCLLPNYVKLRNGNVIGLNWDGYAEDTNLITCIEHDEYKQSVKYLCEYPPKRLAKNDEDFKWIVSNESIDVNSANLIKALTQLRHNLFHGAKYTGATYDDPERTKRLLVEGNTVLKFILSSQFSTKIDL